MGLAWLGVCVALAAQRQGTFSYLCEEPWGSVVWKGRQGNEATSRVRWVRLRATRNLTLVSGRGKSKTWLAPQTKKGNYDVVPVEVRHAKKPTNSSERAP
jgi:hypothetical protein